MTMRIKGTSVWSEGDTEAFLLVEPVDRVVGAIESASPGQFVPFRSRFTHRDTGDETERTVYIRADRVWAISPHLDGDDDDDTDAA